MNTVIKSAAWVGQYKERGLPNAVTEGSATRPERVGFAKCVSHARGSQNNINGTQPPKV